MTDLILQPVSDPAVNAAAINAALTDPQVSKVTLGAGLWLVDAPIIVPTGKTLGGEGRNITTIKAAPQFVIEAGANAVVTSEVGASNVRIADLSIDASKLRPDDLRLNACFMREADGFFIERVDVSNATGYGHFAQGDANRFTTYASGTYTDCNSFNCQIHFEQMTCDGVLLINCNARDGDGDLNGTYFHPLTGSRTWIVEGDTDGDRAADFQLYVNTINGYALTNTDFVL